MRLSCSLKFYYKLSKFISEVFLVLIFAMFMMLDYNE